MSGAGRVMRADARARSHAAGQAQAAGQHASEHYGGNGSTISWSGQGTLRPGGARRACGWVAVGASGSGRVSESGLLGGAGSRPQQAAEACIGGASGLGLGAGFRGSGGQEGSQEGRARVQGGSGEDSSPRPGQAARGAFSWESPESLLRDGRFACTVEPRGSRDAASCEKAGYQRRHIRDCGTARTVL